jgi:predicted RNase H-like HicB family nuclease
MIYAAKIDQTAPDCFEVSFPDKPNAFTFGVSLEDALGMAKDCIETALEADLENGVPLNMPKVRSAKKGLYPIEIDLDTLRGRDEANDILKASESSLAFWDYPEDKIWDELEHTERQPREGWAAAFANAPKETKALIPDVFEDEPFEWEWKT